MNSSIISPIPVVKGKKKEDIVRMLKSYFDDEARTDDINSKLEY